MGLQYDPRLHAASLGLVVVTFQLPPDWRGAYSHEKKTIYLTPGMSSREERSTLAHEVAHAMAGDEFGGMDYFTAKQENRANLLASRALIDFQEYQRAERLHGYHVPSLAQELNVTEFILRFWRRWFRQTQLPFSEEDTSQ